MPSVATQTAGTFESARPSHEVADIFRRYGEKYRRDHPLPVSQTLEEFAADPKHGLGGRTGFTAILHTWDQKLLDHFHLHCLVAGGALSFDGWRFLRAKNN